MTDVLIRLFIKNWDDVDNASVRGRYGFLAGIIGIICNLLLFAAKLIVGTVSGSVSITADAVNNLSDASSSVMTLLGFYIARKPPDEEHPYGHARTEYLSGLAVAALILIIGVQLAKSSVDKILHPSQVAFSVALVVVLVLSIAVKLWLAAVNKKIGKKISSMSLIAAAADSRNDVISTGAVLIAAILAFLLNVSLDGYIGLLVALFILYSGIGIAKDTISPLLGAPADPELVQLVADETLGYDKRILGIHDLMVHDYGPGQRFASVHAEIDKNEDVMSAHEMLDNIEQMFRDKHHIQLVIHYDPIETDNDELNNMKTEVSNRLCAIDERLRLHDFRMVRGQGHTNLIFDVALPHDMEGREKEIQHCLEEGLSHGNMQYYTVISFDSFSFNTYNK